MQQLLANAVSHYLIADRAFVALHMRLPQRTEPVCPTC